MDKTLFQDLRDETSQDLRGGAVFVVGSFDPYAAIGNIKSRLSLILANVLAQWGIYVN